MVSYRILRGSQSCGRKQCALEDIWDRTPELQENGVGSLLWNLYSPILQPKCSRLRCQEP